MAKFTKKSSKGMLALLIILAAFLVLSYIGLPILWAFIISVFGYVYMSMKKMI